MPELPYEGFWRDFRCAPVGCPSDHSISRVYTAKSPMSPKTVQNLDFEQNLHFFRFESAKPLQTFLTPTALRVRRSVRFLSHYSRHNTRKTIKIEQNAAEKRIQNQANLVHNWIFGFPLLGAPPAPAGLVLVCLLYTSPSPRDKRQSRMPSSA